MAAVITTGGVLRYLLKDPDDLGRVLEGIAHGYRLGSAAKPFLAQKWEEGWDRPLAEWRDELDVRVPENMPVGRVFTRAQQPDRSIGLTSSPRVPLALSRRRGVVLVLSEDSCAGQARTRRMR